MNPQKIWFDTETYSETPISDGTYRYVEDSEIMIATYATDNGPVQCIDFTNGEQFPLAFIDAWAETIEIWAQNSMFDRNILRQHHPELNQDIRRWRDTLVQAYSNGLPGALGKICEIMKVGDEDAKHTDGKRLILLFCKPRPKNQKLRRATRLTHPEDWALFKEYAKSDVSAMRAAHYKMPKVNYPNGVDLANWHLDQKINDRGFHVDLELVRAAIDVTAAEKIRLKAETVRATDGFVDSATQRDKLLGYILSEYGISLPDMTKATLTRRLEDPDIPDGVKELLAIRLQATSTSVSKYSKLGKATNDDGRCRGTIQFLGAKRTGRAAGRTFQPQNLPSRGLLSEEETDWGVELLIDGSAPAFVGNLTHLLTSAVRRVLKAPPGCKLVVSDLSNIEGRVGAWLAGESWKLKAFSDFDADLGADLYLLSYAKAFRVDVSTVTKSQRNIGKVMELMLQYQGGVGAFVTGAAGYGFDLEQLSEDIYDTLPADVLSEALGFHKWVEKKNMPTFGLSREAFATVDVLKRLYRSANSDIAAMWPRLESAVRLAISHPGQVYSAGPHLKVRQDKAWLRIKLPSGRFLNYPAAKLKFKGKKSTITFMGDNPYTRQWQRLNTYGGKLFENVCQAIARDVLYWAMQPAEDAGYPIVLHVHDELVTETPDDKNFTADKLSDILAAGFQWTEGLPLAATGFESYEYKK